MRLMVENDMENCKDDNASSYNLNPKLQVVITAV